MTMLVSWTDKIACVHHFDPESSHSGWKNGLLGLVNTLKIAGLPVVRILGLFCRRETWKEITKSVFREKIRHFA